MNETGDGKRAERTSERGRDAKGQDRNVEDCIDESRRALLGFGAAGAGAILLAGCVPQGDEIGEVNEQLAKGTDAFDTYAAIKALSAPTSADGQHVIVGARGRSAIADGGEGFFFWNPSSSVSNNDGTVLAPSSGASGRWQRIANHIVYVSHFGEDATGIQAAFDHAADLGTPVKIVFSPGRAYTVDTTIDVSLPPLSVIEAWGASIECTEDVVAFDLNPGANPSDPGDTVKRKVTWLGGYLHRPDSELEFRIGTAFKCYNIRGLTIHGVRIDSFAYGVKFAGANTYIFRAMQLYDCDVGFLLADWSTEPGGNTISVHWDDVLHSARGGNDGSGVVRPTAAVQAWGEMTDLRVTGGGLGGDYAKGFHFKNSNQAGNEGTTITIEGVHFEQGSSTTKYILFEDASEAAYRCVTVARNTFSHSGVVAVRLERCRGVSIEGNRFGQTVAGSGVPIDIDANCEDVYVGGGNSLARLPTSAAPTYACDRSEVTFAPEVRALNSVVLSGYDGNSFSTAASATIDMSIALGSSFPLVAPPKGYWVNVQARDSASAGATSLVGVRLSKGGVTSNVQRQMLLCLSGLADDIRSGASGFVPADANGDINVAMFATGTNTLDVWISVTGIAM